MTKRYFYTDPRKALWMHEEHGLEIFIITDPVENIIEILSTEKLRSLVAINFKNIYRVGRNVELLKPQGGDAVELIGHRSFPEERYKDLQGCVGNIIKINESGLITPSWADREYAVDIDVQIIQRNGKVFFAPEVEEVK